MNLIPKISFFNNQNSVNFKQAQKVNRLTTYSQFKLIPNLNCACCGRKTVRPIDFHSAFRSITLPLKSIIQRGLLDHWKNHKYVWGLLQNLAKCFPNKSFDQIKYDNQGLHMEILDMIAESLEQNPKYNNPAKKKEKVNSLYHDVLDSSRSDLRCSKKVVERMKAFKKSLEKEPIKLAAFEQLEIYAQKYPQMTLSQILAIEEIHKFHETKDLLQRAETREKLDYHFTNVAKLIEKSSPGSEDLIYDLKDEALDILSKTQDQEARIPKIKKLYTEALTTIGCEKIIKKVHKELEEVPTTFFTKDSFFAYAYKHKLNDYQIISSIFSSSIATSEHIDAASKGGGDNLGNISVFCQRCNLARGNDPYIEFVEYHPEMPKNEQRQINQIANYILKNDVCTKAVFYPMDVAQTLREATDKKVDPDVSKYCEKQSQKLSQVIEAQKDEVKALRAERRQMQEEKDALLKRLYEIDEIRESKKQEIDEINSRVSKNIHRYKEIRSHIDDNKST